MNVPHHRVYCGCLATELMDSVIYARSLMGTSLAFHIVYATLGLGLPLLLVLPIGLENILALAAPLGLARRTG